MVPASTARFGSSADEPPRTRLDSVALLCVDHPHRTGLLDAFLGAEVVSASALALTEAIAGIDRLTDSPIDRGDLEDEVRLLWDQLFVVPVDAGVPRAGRLDTP